MARGVVVLGLAGDSRLVKVHYFEVMLGVLALLLGSSGAFLFAAGEGASAWLYLMISSTMIVALAAILVLRLQRYKTQFVAHLYDQLPAETLYTLRAQGIHRVCIVDMVDLLGDHIRAQEAVLQTQFCLNSVAHEPGLMPQSEAENDWRVLRAELTALHDQFETDRQINSES